MPIGRATSLKMRWLRVRIPPGVPYLGNNMIAFLIFLGCVVTYISGVAAIYILWPQRWLPKRYDEQVPALMIISIFWPVSPIFLFVWINLMRIILFVGNTRENFEELRERREKERKAKIRNLINNIENPNVDAAKIAKDWKKYRNSHINKSDANINDWLKELDIKCDKWSGIKEMIGAD